MSDRIMLDGIGSDAAPIVTAIKAGIRWLGLPATMGAGYGDGSVSAWTSAEWVALTAVAQPVTITVTGQAGRNVADVENGDLTPVQAATWALHEHAAGRYPVLYVNRSNKAAVLASMPPGWVLGKSFGLWVATLDGSFTDLDGSDLRKQPGVVAVQYLGSARSGGPFDVSLVVDSGWLPVKVPPPVVPTWQATALTLAKEALAAQALATEKITSLASVLGAHQ
jgi:hypothetical protein